MADPTFVDLVVMKQELGLVTGDPPTQKEIDRDAILQRLIESATKRMQDTMGRKIFAGTYVYRIDGGWRTDLWPSETPITAVNSLTDSGIVVQAAPNDLGSGYQFDDQKVWLNSGVFSRGNNNVKLEYVGGYSALSLPPDIVEAAIMQVRYQWLRRDNVIQKSQTLGPGQTVSWERDPLIPFALEVCESYKYVAWAG